MRGGFLPQLPAIMLTVLVFAIAGYIFVYPPPPGPISSWSPGVPPSPTLSSSPQSEAVSPHATATAPVPVEPSAPAAAPTTPSIPAPAPSSLSAGPFTPQTQQFSPSTPKTAIPRRSRQYHIQVGAFKYRQNAEILIAELRDRGFTGGLSEGELYRVWVGGPLERADAERLAATLQAAGFETFLSPEAAVDRPP